MAPSPWPWWVERVWPQPTEDSVAKECTPYQDREPPEAWTGQPGGGHKAGCMGLAAGMDRLPWGSSCLTAYCPWAQDYTGKRTVSLPQCKIQKVY